MKKNKKLFVLAALFLAVFAVGGTLAYLTDTSETKTNTFTFGNVDITLTEPTWDTTGSTAAADMAPGQEVDKDPTIKVGATSKNAYIFVKVTIPTGTAGGVADTELFTVGALGSGWTDVTSAITDLDAGEHVYAYGTASAMTSVAKNTTLPAVFTKIKANSALTGTELAEISNTANVVVNAYAIQAEGLPEGHTTPVAVWGDLGL